MMILYYCMTLNSVVNPWIYMMFNCNLVESLRHLLCPCIGEYASHRTSCNRTSKHDLLLFLFCLIIGSGCSRICPCVKDRQDFDTRQTHALRPG